MKTLIQFINEASRTEYITEGYNFRPKDKDELQKIVKRLIRKRGKDANLNDIDVSNITDMSELFRDLDPHNINISNWDVSNVKNMKGMFYYCEHFNYNLSNWDVSNVKDMSYMFYGCRNFNSDLSPWDVRNVKNMSYMFNKCNSLKTIPSWYKK